MADEKTVAGVASQAASIPNTAASPAGELEATGAVTETQTGASAPDAAAVAAKQAQLARLAKARAAKAAKAEAAKTTVATPIEEQLAALQAQLAALQKSQNTASNTPIPAAPAPATNSIASIQDALAQELAADKHAFGDIREVGRTIPTAEEYVKVEIPLADLFDHTHPGVQLNRHKFEPGKTYLLRGDVALEVKKRLAMFHDEQVRLLRPNADRKALNDVNRGSQWTSRGGNAIVPLGRLEDVSVASDEKIYTVDF